MGKPKTTEVFFKKCSVDGCSEIMSARGFCSSHYHKWKRWGDPLHTGGTAKPQLDEAGRIVRKVILGK